MQPLAREFDHEPRDRQADPDLVEPDQKRSFGADSHIRRQEQKGTSRHAVTGAGDHHGCRKREQPLGERRPEHEHLLHRRSTGGEDLEVKSSREVAIPAGQDHDRAIPLGLINGCVQRTQHRDR